MFQELQIYLYQRWAYRVDPSRLNEFGTSLEKETGAAPVEGSQPDSIQGQEQNS